MKWNICFWVVFLLGGAGYAQSTISGRVVDELSGETLPFAALEVVGTNINTTTNVDGFFTLFGVTGETVTVRVHYVGYEVHEITVKISDEPINISMNATNLELQEVIVTATNLESQMISASDYISQISLSPKALSSIPSIGEQDIFRALQLLPGVSGTNEASSGLYIRGGTPDQNLILLDGFTVYHVDHFYGFFSAFNPNAIKDVQLYKGGFESKFGGRLSSVMELTGKVGNQHKVSGGVGIGAISANAYVEVPIGKKFNIFMAGRRSYTDILESGIYNNIFDLYNDQSDATVQTSNVPQQGGGQGNRNVQEEETEPTFFFYDLNAKLSFRPSDRDIISLSFYNGKDDLDNSRITNNEFQNRNEDTITINNDINDLLQWGNFGSSVRWARQWNQNYYSNLILGYSNYFSDRNRLSLINITRPDTAITRNIGTVETNDLYDYSVIFNNEYKVDANHTLEFGGQAIYNDIRYEYELNDTIALIDEANDGTLASLYLQDNWKATEKLNIIGGLRTSYYDVTEKSYYEPRLSLAYKLNDKTTFKGAWGHYYQFVNRIVREDVSEGSRDFWLLANDDNSPVSFSRHYIAAVTHETEDLLMSVELFDKSLEGISEFSLRFQSDQRNPDEEAQYFFEGTGVARGMELLVQKKAGNLKGWVSYTLSEVVHDIPGISDFPYYALHDSRHEVNVVATYDWRKFTFGATWVYGTGKPYTAPYGEYDITTLDGTSYEYISVGAKNAFRLPDYHRMDVSINYLIKIGKGEGNIGLSLFNLYDRENIWYKEFLVEEEEVIETNVNLIGFTPNLNLSFKF